MPHRLYKLRNNDMVETYHVNVCLCLSVVPGNRMQYASPRIWMWKNLNVKTSWNEALHFRGATKDHSEKQLLITTSSAAITPAEVLSSSG